MRNLVLYTAAGVRQTPSDVGVYTLADATTYYAEMFDDLMDRPLASIHWQWNAALVAVITIDGSNFSTTDATPYATAGWVATAAPSVSATASANEVLADYANISFARMRAKIVVTTGGTLKAVEHAKLAGGM